jgi:hypothetical protein
VQKKYIMKKLFTFLLATFLISGYSKGQITLTASQHNPEVGDSYEQNIDDNPPAGVTAGPSGANVSWDFSNLNASSVKTVNIQASTNSSFPDADIFFTQSGTQTYFGVHSNAFTYYGITSSSATVNLSDGEDHVRFPITYNDSYMDSKQGTTTGFGQTLDLEGNVQVSADGYGTLTTPEATYNNSLRIQIIRTDSAYYNGAYVNTTVDTFYYWYVDAFNFPVATCSGSGDNIVINYLTDNSTTITTGEKKQQIDIQQNPVDHYLKLEGDLNNAKLVIYDISGKNIKSFENTSILNISNFAPGIYFLQIKKKNQPTRALKFIKS